MHTAASYGHVEIAKKLLDLVPEWLDAVNAKGQLPLHVAAEKGHKPFVEMLLHAGNEVNIRDRRGKSPLHYAVEEGHEEVTRTLLDAGADVKLKDNWRRTPFAIAKQNGHIWLTEALRLEVALDALGVRTDLNYVHIIRVSYILVVVVLAIIVAVKLARREEVHEAFLSD